MKCTVISGTETRTVFFDTPQKLSDLLLQQDLAFSMPCGQNGTCGKCAILVTGSLSEPDERELKFLADKPEHTRLACRCMALSDCEIILPTSDSRIVSDGILPFITLDPMEGDYGFAVDIGTTTVAVYLYDLKTGNCIERETFMNPQQSFGADVISRIEKASSGQEDALQKAILSTIEKTFLSIMRKRNLTASSAVITGNTAMLYLFIREDTKPMTAAPFEIDNYLGTVMTDLFPALPQMKVYLPRTAAAFVGSDITCSMLACGMHASKETVLMVDIGTNGEMGLLHNGNLSVCATAAGPAFEGAGITYGMSAASGAIDSVTASDGTIRHTVIGGTKATGICGTGLIDTAAMLLKTALIDETGCIDEENEVYAAYLTEYDDSPAVRLTENVLITQQDVRQLQLAKAAICAGIDTLLETAGITPDEVDIFYIAGGFGRYINTASAATIGLFPRELVSKAKAVGNASGSGASMLLLSKGLIADADRMAIQANVVDLSTSPIFMEQYIERMYFDSED